VNAVARGSAALNPAKSTVTARHKLRIDSVLLFLIFHFLSKMLTYQRRKTKRPFMNTYRTTPLIAKENRISLAPQTTSKPYETTNFRIHFRRRQVKQNPFKMGNLEQNPVVTTYRYSDLAGCRTIVISTAICTDNPAASSP
jgi:hypothetical protein